MKFSRKLMVRQGSYGTISVPKPVLDAWKSFEEVEMQFHETTNSLVITPVDGGTKQYHGDEDA
jgi:hypothetical protein